ncbi:MAG: hypothetical protein RMM53_01230 [Bacteroidia bacterium]|nr:hypothetical protein [Bacteroidia bacterium]MDW8332816.1 hypothetical protein [Bacteroidia bacterium]
MRIENCLTSFLDYDHCADDPTRLFDAPGVNHDAIFAYADEKGKFAAAAAFAALARSGAERLARLVRDALATRFFLCRDRFGAAAFSPPAPGAPSASSWTYELSYPARSNLVLTLRRFSFFAGAGGQIFVQVQRVPLSSPPQTLFSGTFAVAPGQTFLAAITPVEAVLFDDEFGKIVVSWSPSGGAPTGLRVETVGAYASCGCDPQATVFQGGYGLTFFGELECAIDGAVCADASRLRRAMVLSTAERLFAAAHVGAKMRNWTTIKLEQKEKIRAEIEQELRNEVFAFAASFTPDCNDCCFRQIKPVWLGWNV